MSMLNPQPPASRRDDRFRALCAEIEEYENLPELMPGDRATRLITDQSHEDSLHESILAGLTQP